jgi:hypothetical protein
MSGVYPDYPAPVVLKSEVGRLMRIEEPSEPAHIKLEIEGLPAVLGQGAEAAELRGVDWWHG